MSKYRMKFSKRGRAVYISHLDLMHTMQRAFSRAGLKLEYSQGFNPHPQISMAMPLSVGISSICELMDFSLSNEMECEEILKALNPVLPEGIEILSVYLPQVKLSGIKWLQIDGKLEYDTPVPGAEEELNRLFKSESLTVEKKTKRGFADIDVIPAVHSIAFTEAEDGKSIALAAVISASEPVLNPVSITEAIKKYSPGITPDFASFTRIKVFDEKMTEFE